MTSSIAIQLPSGTVHATVSDGVLDARGVRYGSAPARMGAPVAAPVVVQGPPSAFPQVPGLLDTLLGPALGELEQSEDSFSVRIQAPADAPASGLPVLFFVHGGGFTTGSAEARWYDAADLVRRGRLVLVTVNHRLGAAALPPVPGPAPTFGDLVTAARWVRAHVAAFGGDPTDVTVMGDSAGAWWAHALSTSEETAGLFRRTVLVSMPRMEPLSAADDAQRRTLFADALAAQGPVAQCSPERALRAQQDASRSYRGAGFPFAPAAGDDLPPRLGNPRHGGARLHTQRVLCVTTADEASAFLRPRGPETFAAEDVDAAIAAHYLDPLAARDALLPPQGSTPYLDAVAVQTHWQFQSVAQDLAAGAEVPVHLARLDVCSPLPDVGSPHCFTLPFLFGNLDAWSDAPMLEGLDPTTAVNTAAALGDLLIGFVHDTGTGAPAWDDSDPRLLAVGADGTRLVPALAPELEVLP